MTSIEAVFSASELALASYATLSNGETEDQIDALQRGGDGLSASQAQDFADRFPAVVAQVNDELSGFSATVFRDASGQIALAVRGSEPDLNDWLLVNSDIAAFGAGYLQIISLYNTWQQLTHKQGELLTLYRFNPLNPGLVTAELVTNHLGTPQEALVSPMASVDVAGHSLGGHLALAFAGLFPLNARQVLAFNAPGFIDSPNNSAFFASLGGMLPTGTSPAGVADAAYVDLSMINWSGPVQVTAQAAAPDSKKLPLRTRSCHFQQLLHRLASRPLPRRRERDQRLRCDAVQEHLEPLRAGRARHRAGGLGGKEGTRPSSIFPL